MSHDLKLCKHCIWHHHEDDDPDKFGLRSICANPKNVKRLRETNNISFITGKKFSELTDLDFGYCHIQRKYKLRPGYCCKSGRWFRDK